MKKQKVIVAGSGNAGLCAGIAALEKGAGVLIVEKADEKEAGGNSRYTAGAMRFAYQSREELLPLLSGPDDERLACTEFGTYTQEKFREDLLGFNGGRALGQHQLILVENSYGTLRWLASHHVRFEPIYARQSFEKDGKYIFWGGLTLEAKGEGVGLVEAELQEFLRLGGKISYETEAKELLLENNKITGLRCTTPQGEVGFPADAVVLACGGFIDGLGGAATVTSKVVMVQPSQREGIDVDYLFAQVEIEEARVDTTPPCGNMMAGVAPFAIERGMVRATHPETSVMVFNINTNSVIEEIVQTPHGKVQYDGNAKIDGVPGTASPIVMNLFDQVGGKTGSLFPTGKRKETIQGVEVSLVDAGIPMVLMKASGLGMQGDEPAIFFEQNPVLIERIEKIRLEAGERMGLGDVRESVLPKVGLLSKPRHAGNNIKSQYLTPHVLHPAHAVTGAICIGTALKTEGTVAAEVGRTNGAAQELLRIEHPSGIIEVQLEMEEKAGGEIHVNKAGTIRTVRKIMEGYVFY